MKCFRFFAAKCAMLRAKKVRLMIFDIDGVMTAGHLYYSDSGEELKAFNVRDGLGLRMLQKSGVALAIITGRTSKLVEHRARDLGIDHLIQGAADKLVAFQQLLAATNLDAEQCGFMGDDVIDLPVLRRVTFAVSVPNGAMMAKQQAHYITQNPAGHGAVREVCDLILKAQGNLDKQLAVYLT